MGDGPGHTLLSFKGLPFGTIKPPKQNTSNEAEEHAYKYCL